MRNLVVMTSRMGRTSSNRGNPDQKWVSYENVENIITTTNKQQQKLLSKTRNNPFQGSIQENSWNLQGLDLQKVDSAAVSLLKLQSIQRCCQTHLRLQHHFCHFLWRFRQAPNVKIASPSEFNPVLVLNEPHPHPWDGAGLELSEFGEPFGFQSFRWMGVLLSLGHDTYFMKSHTEKYDIRSVSCIICIQKHKCPVARSGWMHRDVTILCGAWAGHLSATSPQNHIGKSVKYMGQILEILG